MFKKLGTWLYHNSIRLDYLQAASYLVFALMYLKFWLYPMEKTSFLKDSIHLFVLEFIMVAGAAFISVLARSNRVYPIIWVFGSLIYTVSRGFNNDYFFYAYLVLVINRMRVAFIPYDVRLVAGNILTAVVSVGLFMFAALTMGVLSNFIPILGLTEGFLENAGYGWQMGRESGMLVEKPHLVMYFWFVYFLGAAIASYWITKKKREYRGKNERVIYSAAYYEQK